MTTSTDSTTSTNTIQAAGTTLAQVEQEIGKVIIGQHELINRLLLGLLCNGHILIEGIPGLAKTLAVSTLSQTLEANFNRIQFTPDLLPGDLIGTMVYNPKTGDFNPHRGPIFTNILLADEINRAPAKVQSALLEAMQEKQVTIGNETHSLAQPFMVLATQNPIEQEGTYQLPEAQLDRFMFKVTIDYPNMDDEHAVMKRMAHPNPDLSVNRVMSLDQILSLRKLIDAVHIEETLERYILKLVDATRRPDNYDLDCSNLIRHGASPRASIFLSIAARGYALMQGRDYVVPDDIKSVGMDILRHRVALTYRAEAANTTSEDIIALIFKTVEVS